MTGDLKNKKYIYIFYNPFLEMCTHVYSFYLIEIMLHAQFLAKLRV
jgi:hypothetical protein